MNYKNIKSIVFICKYNAFRSKIAELYFKKINKNNKIKVVSRGFIIGEVADKMQKRKAKEIGIEIKGKSKPLILKELIKSDLIIVVAKDIPKIMFNYWLEPINKKVVFWKISDEQKMNEKNIERIIKKIMKKVEMLVKQLEREK
jgi:protein-tyrosine-phosphatase|tara:strand:+ start:658 stop:1089 length:432 start_codon:yes stop_codon:yes gene_type:complete